LAIQLGYDLADYFPDGVFFVDCGSAEDPLAMLLRTCGASPLPETAVDMATRWRTVWSGAGRRQSRHATDQRPGDYEFTDDGASYRHIAG
jgi:hypothetical protein